MYLVVFRNRKRADIDGEAYARDAVAMEALARLQLLWVRGLAPDNLDTFK